MAGHDNLPDYREWVEGVNRSPDDFDNEGEDPMTDEQTHRLKALCWRLGERFDASWSRDEADRRIAELQRRE